MSSQPDIWTYRASNRLAMDASDGVDITGYRVEALDGSIGKVADGSFGPDPRYIVVDTGPWIFGKKVMLPAGVIQEVDPAHEKVYVHRTKDEIKHAPEFDEEAYATDAYRARVADYYGQGGGGWRSW